MTVDVVAAVAVGVTVFAPVYTDTSSAERNLSLCRVPATNTLDLSGVVIMMLGSTAIGDVHDRTTGIQAAIRHVFRLKCCSEGYIAGDH